MMKKVFLFLLAIVATIPLSAQIQRGLKDSYDLDSFPNVSFVWNSPVPVSQFALFEDDVAVNILSCSELPIDSGKTVNKSILFLWEDMASHSNQSDFTRKLLTRFFSETNIAPADRFEVAVFDRKRDPQNTVLNLLTGKFTSDKQQLIRALADYQRNYRYYDSFWLQTDLYQAIEEGVEILKKEPADRSGVIVVITAGLNMKASGSHTEMETVRVLAIESGIPIYVVKYPLFGDTPEVNDLSAKTFGLSFSATKVAEALRKLQQNYQDMDNRLHGYDYKLVFESKSECDGKNHRLLLKVDNSQHQLVEYRAPKATLGMWIKKHLLLAGVLLLLTIGIVVLIVILVLRWRKKRQEAAEAMQEQIRREREESERRSREAMEALRQEQESKNRAAKDAARRKQEAEDEARIVRLMQAKNLFPRLQCKCGTKNFNYTISKPKTTLGRDANNDLPLNSQTVSGRHAEIVFNGSSFEIINRSHSYRQGVNVNGQFCQSRILCNGDTIALGNVIISFYL